MTEKEANADIVFDGKNPRPAAFYLSELKKLFTEVAPDATQEQKDLFAQLQKAILARSSHIIGALQMRKERVIQECLLTEETNEDRRINIIRVVDELKNQIGYHSKTVEMTNTKIGEESKSVEDLGQKIAVRMAEKDRWELEMNNLEEEFKEKTDGARLIHQLNITALQTQINELKVQIMLM